MSLYEEKDIEWNESEFKVNQIKIYQNTVKHRNYRLIYSIIMMLWSNYNWNPLWGLTVQQNKSLD